MKARWMDYVRLLQPRLRAEWSIGIYTGSGPLSMSPHPALGSMATVSAKSLGAVRAQGVADPFMVQDAGGWLMFFEVESRASGRGEIGLARSRDAVSWQFEGIVLKEPFHLSYPHVFEFEGSYYMLPECATTGTLRLYKADAFPVRWRLNAVLLRGDFADATPFRHAGIWWLIAIEGFGRRDAMVIYHADTLQGPWLPHASNPISAGNRRNARPAGRIVRHEGQLMRLAQDDEARYGTAVRAYVIEELTAQTYVERPALPNDQPVLAATGRGWNASGMHHMDAHQVKPGQWLACVDGRRTVWHWPVLDRVRKRLLAAGEQA